MFDDLLPHATTHYTGSKPVVVSNDNQEVGPLEDSTLKEPRQYVNPVYGNEEDVMLLEKSVAPAPALAAETAETAETVEYSTIDQPQYSVLNRKTDEHKFDNPIYGDEMASNVYSVTSHSANPQASTAESAPESEYNTLEGPQYEMPFSVGNGQSKTVSASPHYEEADVLPEPDPVPSATIYSEIEEHDYSVLQQ